MKEKENYLQFFMMEIIQKKSFIIGGNDENDEEHYDEYGILRIEDNYGIIENIPKKLE